MRILMVIDSYPPTIGGAQLHVRHLALELAGRGHAVAVATLWQRDLPEFEVDRGVRVYRIRGTARRASRLLFRDAGRVYAPPAPDPECTRALRRIVAHERPQVVHGHNWLLYSFLPLKAWSGARVMATLHEYSLACPRWTLMAGEAPCSGPGLLKCLSCAADYYGPLKGTGTVLAKRLMATVERAVDLYLPVSRAVAAGNGLPGSGLPFRVVPNFVLDDVAGRSADDDPRLAALPREPYLLYVGALQRNKGVEVLTRAYAGLREAPPLVLIGSTWPDTPRELPPNVTMHHDWPHSAVMAAWRRSVLGLVPSIWPEPCPTVVMEAMACGRAVVASRTGGLPELVVDGQTGLLVPPGDSDALRGAMQALVDSPATRARFGQAALAKVHEFQAAAVVPRIEQLYRELVGPTAAPERPAALASAGRHS